MSRVVQSILPHALSWLLRLVVLASAAVTVGVLQPASAQTALPGADGAPLRPFEVLLEHQETLGLTEDQLQRLDRIRAWLVRANEPLVRRMLALRRQWQRDGALEDGRADAERRERIRAAAEALRARIARNNRAAMRSVNGVLTPEQRAELRAIVQERQVDGAGRLRRERSNAGGN
jgi:Spy/CpxP family protein refolding chaperone